MHGVKPVTTVVNSPGFDDAISKENSCHRIRLASLQVQAPCRFFSLPFSYEGSGQKKGSTSSVRGGVQMIFTRPRIISNSPQNTSMHTYDNIIPGPLECISGISRHSQG